MSGYEIAVLGYGVRVPGADTLEAFWTIIRTRRDVVARQSSNVGATAESRVHAYGLLPAAEAFDERYFAYSPREAADIDPQQRLLLECAVEALEASAVPADAADLDIATYCAVGLSSYLLHTLEPGRVGDDRTSALVGGDGHYAATRIAYKLGLTGPAVSVGTACSSSLVAVHLAAQALLAGECDVALAGGMDVEYPQPRSYVYQDGGVMSRSGVCRPFDGTADGVVFASGGGLVVLAPLALAQERGWPVRAVLHGTAINNDGANKASFTAPLATRQADVIRQALMAGAVDASEVGYVECHGTGTQLGDRSELLALELAYEGRARPYLGSLKANLGHLRVGAGVAGFVKACEVVARRTIPPMAGAVTPMDRVTEIGARIPVTAVDADGDRPFVAGVSSFGFGGTNAHAVVGSHAAGAPAEPTGDEAADPAVIRLSAPTPESCLATAVRVADHLDAEPSVGLTAVARTLERGRAALRYRCAAVGTREQVGAALRTATGDRFVEGWADSAAETVVLFPGQGSDLRPAGRMLYGWEPRFTAALDESWSVVRQRCPQAPSVRELLDGAETALGVSHAAHVAIALARYAQLAERGLRGSRFVGYSLGEYAAAAAAGAVDGGHAVALALARGELLAGQPSGELFVVDAAEAVHRDLGGRYHAAIRQSPQRVVYSVAADAGPAFTERLRRDRIPHRRVDVDVAYHSPQMRSVAAAFRPVALGVPVRTGTGFLPTVAGAQFTDGSYFADHLHRPLDYSGLAEALEPAARLVDLDPARLLSRLLAGDRNRAVVAVDAADRVSYLLSLADAWVQGVDLSTLAPGAARGRLVALPTTAFQRSAHLKEPVADPSPAGPAAVGSGVRREPAIDRWMYYPSWTAKRRRESLLDVGGQRWLVLVRSPVFAPVLDALRAKGVDVVPVDAAPVPPDGAAAVVPGDRSSTLGLLDRLGVTSRPIDRVLHLWCAEELEHGATHGERMAALGDELARGFYTLLYLVQGLAERQGAHLLHLDIVGRGMHPLEATTATPERALLAGPALVIPQDLPFATTRSIELAGAPAEVTTALLAELLCDDSDKTVVLTGRGRWVRGYERDHVPAVPDGERPFRLRDGGVYLITGGVGGIGMTIAEYLVRQCRANLVLTGLDVVPTQEMLEAAEEPDVEDPVMAERTRRIRALVARGARVLTSRCDAADLDQTRALFATVDATFGRLDGVVHAAGVFETQRAFRGLEDTGPDDCSRRLLPKVDGTLVLAECLRGRRLDFLLMQSSLSSHLGGLGFYAYTAGNAYMDAFAERHRTEELPWMSVNWDGWVFTEQDESAATSVVSPSFASPDFGVVAEIAIRPSEGAEIYGRLMNLADPHLVLVSTADFDARIDSWVGLDTVRRTRADGPAGTPPTGSEVEMTPTEVRVAAGWREILGVTALSPEHNFFAIGGDSLLGVALAYRLSTEFDVVLSVITLFDNPTVAAMAAEVDRALAAAPVGTPA